MLALLAGAGMAISPLQSAYVIEIDTDGADDGTVTYNPDFSFGGDTTLAYQSAASSAIGLTECSGPGIRQAAAVVPRSG